MIYTVFEKVHLTQAAVLERHAPEPWTKAQLESELCTPAAKMFAAITENGTLAAFCAFQCAGGEGNLNAITVAPKYRRQGVAHGLLQFALSRLDASEVFLEVRAQNISALALYKKLGFCEVGTRHGFYSSPPDDAIIMKLIK